MLAVLGDLVQDVVIWPRQEINPGTDTPSDVFIRRGGSAANVAAFAGRRYPTRFLGCVGDDLAGRALCGDLEDHEVQVLVQRRGETGVIVVLVDPAGERSMFPSRGASRLLESVDPEWLEGVELLHLTLYSLQSEPTRTAAMEAAHQVMRIGGRISLDLSSVGLIAELGADLVAQLVEDMAPSLISANLSEARAAGLIEERGTEVLVPMPRSTTLILRGAEGGVEVIDGGGSRLRVPLTSLHAVRDSTGAGDAFNAGLLVSVLRDGFQPLLNVQQGHRLAALVLDSPGASETGATPSTLGE